MVAFYFTCLSLLYTFYVYVNFNIYGQSLISNRIILTILYILLFPF